MQFRSLVLECVPVVVFNLFSQTDNFIIPIWRFGQQN